MSSLHISIPGLDALVRGMHEAPEYTRRELLTTVTQASLLVEREVKERMPKHTGQTAASVSSRSWYWRVLTTSL